MKTKSEETKDLGSKVVGAILSAAYVTLCGLGLYGCINDIKDYRARVAYANLGSGSNCRALDNKFGTLFTLNGFDRDCNGEIDEIKLKYITVGGARMVIPASHTYSVKDKEFAEFREILEKSKK